MKLFFLLILFILINYPSCAYTPFAVKQQILYGVSKRQKHHRRNLPHNSVPSTVYKSMVRIGSNYFATLKIDTMQIKQPLLPRREFKENDYLVDSAYYSQTLLQSKTYRLDIYKSGNRYQSKIGDEGLPPVDYLVLVTTDHNQRIIDHLVCYYDVHMLYESDERYFKINKNKNIVLTDFYVDEFKITFKGKRFYRINNKGKFIFIRKEKSL